MYISVYTNTLTFNTNLYMHEQNYMIVTKLITMTQWRYCSDDTESKKKKKGVWLCQYSLPYTHVYTYS